MNEIVFWACLFYVAAVVAFGAGYAAGFSLGTKRVKKILAEMVPGLKGGDDD